ncbi:hypothetical protein [Nonomuraea sp. LPB2021202275-12-8]|uniref:hypothetical protein n=1 Tax=Nonomuraea sp. LPB2021202275-12-8 TaxID=3120159 RepID=UPI00300D6543
MAERTVVIRDNSVAPEKGEVFAFKQQIEQWLLATSPIEVHGAGLTYAEVSAKIKAVADALPGIASKLDDCWSSESSAKAQKALQRLNASGASLADATGKMGEALTAYGRDYLPAAREKIQALNRLSDGEVSIPSSELPASTSNLEPNSPLDDFKARGILQTLNEQISDLYFGVIPATVSIDLPEISLPGPDTGRQLGINTPTTYNQGDYRDGIGSPGGPDGSDRSSTPGGAPSGLGSDAGTSDPGDRSGSQPPTGGTPGGDSPSGDSPSGDSPGGDTPGSDTPGADTPGADTPGAGDPQDGASPGDQDEATSPAVIGGDDTSDETSMGTPGEDPDETEAADYSPQTITPTTVAPPTTATPLTGQPQIIPAHQGTTGVPSVIGGQSTFGQAGTIAASAGRAGLNGMGMPLMPMMGGGGAGEQQADLERTTYLSEDRDLWSPAERSTTPVIEA